MAGPEEWGWGGYFISGYDQQWSAAHDWSSFPDRDAHAGWAYLPWLLDQFRRAEVAVVHLHAEAVHSADLGDGTSHEARADDADICNCCNRH